MSAIMQYYLVNPNLKDKEQIVGVANTIEEAVKQLDEEGFGSMIMRPVTYTTVITDITNQKPVPSNEVGGSDDK